MTTKAYRKAPAWLLILSFAYVAILAALTLMNRLVADGWWFGALNLYLPQVIWAVPGILLGFILLIVDRKWIWLPLLGIALTVGPLMGFCWPFLADQKSPDSLPLRVMTWNVKYGNHDELALLRIIHEIDLHQPAVVFIQDARGLLNGPLGDYFNKWNVRSYGQYIIASRLPLGELQVRRISFLGEEHTCVRTQLQFGDTEVALYNIHFQTPRWGLNALRVTTRRPWYLPEAIQQLENNVEERLTQARTLRDYIRQERMPIIVAGDLNSSDASQVCATLRVVDLHDAFAEGGKGYGYTYGHHLFQRRLPTFNHSWMRIDHIMVSSHFQSRHCWTGTGEASGHRPVIADLVMVHS